jgi:ubiquinol-cytochrome c reductase iron-sulfur subunit
VTARDTRPGTAGGTSSVAQHGDRDADYTREELAAMSREELDRLGAAYDEVEILHVAPGPVPGSRLERRAVRQVSFVFGLAGFFAFLFVFFYVGSGWFLPDWRFTIDGVWGALFTPFLGACMGLALFLTGVGLVMFTKKLLPHETAVQQQHHASHVDQMTTAATAQAAYHNSGLGRRKMITR